MFITPEEFGNLSAETLNSVLERAYNKAIEDTLCLLPEVILSLVVKTKGTQQTLEDFYKKYPALKGKESELSLAVQAAEFANPNGELSVILEGAAKILESAKDIPVDQPSTKEEAERTANGFL
jgi:hypothetical protein